MQFLKYALIASMAVCVLVILVKAAKSKEFFKTIFWSAFFGVLTLICVSAVSLFGIETLPLNTYTVGCSAICGIPGTLTMLLTKTIWMI